MNFIAKIFSPDGSAHRQWPDAIETVPTREYGYQPCSKPLYAILDLWVRRVMARDGAIGFYHLEDGKYSLVSTFTYDGTALLTLPRYLDPPAVIIPTLDGSYAGGIVIGE